MVRGYFQILEDTLLGFRQSDPELDVRYWRTSTGLEVDFILGDMEVAIEVKASRRVHEADLRALAALAEEQPVRRLLVVGLESEPRRLGRVEVLPWTAFLEALWSGDLVGGNPR